MSIELATLVGSPDPVFAKDWHGKNESSSLIFSDDAASQERGQLGGFDVVVIERRTLVRDCLVQCLKTSLSKETAGFPSVDAFLSAQYKLGASTLYLLCAGGRPGADVARDWSRLVRALVVGSSVIVLADDETPASVFEALKAGVRGYIPTSVSVNVAIGALNLVRAGGTFIPTSCLNDAHDVEPTRNHKSIIEDMFTARQLLVVQEIRKGRSNKVIANVLQIEESTVKVHVRNIMRKLKAHSRTEVAFLVSEMDAQLV